MSGLQNLSLEQAAVLIASRVRVKQAVESTTKPEYSQTLQQPVTQPDPPRNATSPAGGEPGIMDRVRAALSNIDFGSLANKGMDAAKGFSPSSNPLHAALLGGGLGMGVGALGSLTSSDKEKRKRWLRNALFGGAMGGIGGAGLSAAMGYGNKLMTDESARQKAEMEKPQVPMATERVADMAGETAATLRGKGLPSAKSLKQLRDDAGTAIYNFGAPIVDKVQSVYNDPAGALEAFRRSTVKPFVDNPGASMSAAANNVKNMGSNLIDGVSGTVTDVANNPEAFMQPIHERIGQYRGAVPIVGGAAGAVAANVLNRHSERNHVRQTLANPKFMPSVIGKGGVNSRLNAAGHPEITPQQLAAASGIRHAGGRAGRPPAMSSTQDSAMREAAKAFNTTTPLKQRNRLLWGGAGAALGAFLGSQYTPHLSNAQKQQ